MGTVLLYLEVEFENTSTRIQYLDPSRFRQPKGMPVVLAAWILVTIARARQMLARKLRN